MVGVDAGVEHGDGGARAGEAQRLHVVALITGNELSSASFSGTSTWTARTCGDRRSRSRSDAGTFATRCAERFIVRVTVPSRSTDRATDGRLASES